MTGPGPADPIPTRPRRPYLLRAMHEWMSDSGQTPHVVVDAAVPGVVVPAEHIREGKIVLNLSHAATRGLVIGNDTVQFEARFGGRPWQVTVPVHAVLGIYARETGQGMIFGEEGGPEPPEPEPSGRPGKPKLKVVK